MVSIFSSRLRVAVALLSCVATFQANAGVWTDFGFNPVDNEFTRKGYADPEPQESQSC